MTTKKSTGDKGGGVTLKESSAVANDISQTIANKLENVVNLEKKRTTKKSTKSSKLKSPKDTIGNSIDKVDNGGVGFKSSIIFGNEFDVALPKRCAVSTQDTSELIAKQLEDVVIAEKTDKKVKPSKLPSSKSKEKASSDKSSKMDFESSVNIMDSVNAIPPETSSSSSIVGITKQPAERSKDDVYVKNNTGLVGYDESDNMSCSEGIDLKKKEVRQGTRLKSSLKTSRSKGASRSVNWADEKNNEALEDKKDRSIVDENNDEALDHKKDKLQVVQEEDSESSLRLTSAEACAAALAQAAEAVAAGEVEAADAVSEAGIVILPQQQLGDGCDSEADGEAFEFDQGVLKWPKKTVLLDTDMFDVDDSWHDTPPEGFSLTLSSFATMWMALFGWITCSSLAYIYGRHDSSHEEFLWVQEREYPRKIFLKDGKSSEIRLALDGFICRALPGVVMELRLSTPVSTLEKFVGRLLDTMSFVDALPSFKLKQWQVIVLLFIEALSVHRLPSLASQMTSRSMLLHKVLNAAQVSSDEYETMRDLIMPLGRVPQFAMQRGG